MKEYDVPGRYQPVGEFILPTDVAIEFEPVFEKWGGVLRQVQMQLPDFTAANWATQYYPGEGNFGIYDVNRVGGTHVHVPYMAVDREITQEGLDGFLDDLIQYGVAGGYTFILDVGDGSSLSPLTLAGLNRRTIVFGVDGGVGPASSYPFIPGPHVYPDHEYPYVARLLTQVCQFHDSMAFHIPRYTDDNIVQQRMQELAYRVHITAPDPDEGLDPIIQMMDDVSPCIVPGGNLVLLGGEDSLRLYQMEFLATQAKASFQSNQVLALRGRDIVNVFGVGHSGWFSSAEDYFDNPKHPDRLIPVGMLRGKR